MEYNLKKLNECLASFASYTNKYGNGITNALTLDFKKHSGHIIFSGIVHGNEVGSLPSIIKIIQELVTNEISYGGKVSFFLGNVPAALKNQRFLERDLNRSFGLNTLLTDTVESKRAQELTPLLTQADVYLDFHQTIMPCIKPFYIFEMDYSSYYWARAAGIANTYVTRKKGSAFSTAGMCTDEYVRSQGKVGITIELGEKGFSPFAEMCSYQIMRRSLKNMDFVHLHHICIKKLAHKNNDFEFLQISYKEQFDSPEKRLNDGLKNFTYLAENECIGYAKNNSLLKTPATGYLLFPKYPTRDKNLIAQAPLPGELYVLAKKLETHPLKWLSSLSQKKKKK